MKGKAILPLQHVYTCRPQLEMCAVIHSGQIPLEWLKGAYVVHMGTVNTHALQDPTRITESCVRILPDTAIYRRTAKPAHTHLALLFSAL